MSMQGETLFTKKNIILAVATVVVLYLMAGGNPENIERGFEAVDKTIEMNDRLEETVNKVESKFGDEVTQ